jgi:predicted transcriptional regulator
MKVAARKVVNARRDYDTLVKIVRQNPGVHYRELLRASGLGNGTLQHQLASLERLGLLRAHRSGGFTRYIIQMYQRQTWNYSTASNNEHVEK